MLNKLISRLRQDDGAHPLSSEKRIAEVLAEFRPEEGEGAVLDVDHWLLETETLAAVLDSPAFRRAVVRLDEFVQGPLAATWSAWFRSAHPLYLSDKAWQTLVNHYAAVDKGYALCLAAPDLSGLEDKTLPACFAARAMRAMVQGKKLQRLRYRAPDPAWWSRAGQLLGWARERGASQAQVVVYPGEEPSSVWREYLVGVYLDLAPVDGMLQRQIEATDAVLRKCAGSLIVRAQPAGNELYCLDPATGQGPFRRDENASYPGSVGYVGFDSLRAQIVRLIAQLRAGRDDSLPDWLAHTHATSGQLRDLLHLLAMTWSSSPPKRMAARRNGGGDVRAVFGFGMVRRMAACSSLARSGRRIDYDSYLDMMRRDRFGKVGDEQGSAVEAEPEIPVDPMDLLARLEATGQQQQMETWRLQDISDSGIGAQLPHLLNRHAIGRLIGYRPVGEVDWRAGVIRRLRRDGAARLIAGIECLAGLPVCAQVKTLQKLEDKPWAELKETGGHGFIDAVLLSGTNAELLLPPGTFTPDGCLRLVVEGRSRNVRMTTLVGGGDDYERVAFVDIATPNA